MTKLCGHDECETILSQYNRGRFCSLHEPFSVPRMRGTIREHTEIERQDIDRFIAGNAEPPPAPEVQQVTIPRDRPKIVRQFEVFQRPRQRSSPPKDSDLDVIKKAVSTWLEVPERTRLFRSGVLLWSALHVGTNLKRLRMFTQLPHTDINNCSYRFRHSGIWEGNGRDTVFCYEWLGALEKEDYVTACIGFICDAMTGIGVLERINTDDGATYQEVRYGSVSYADWISQSHQSQKVPLGV